MRPDVRPGAGGSSSVGDYHVFVSRLMPAHRKSERARRALIVLIALALLVPLIPLRAIPAQATGYSGTILADSPIAYWRLGETSGITAADASGHGNAGTYAGAAGAYTLGQAGALFGDADPATKLDGQAGHVVVPNSAGLQTNQVSIELWIKKLIETPWGTYVSQ